MKKFTLITLALMTATSVFALPPPKRLPVPQNNKPRIVFRKDISVPVSYVGGAPSTDIANAVAITGVIATGLRVIQELTTPPPPPAIIVVGDNTGDIIIQEMEPVIKHPVPISVTPIQVISMPAR